ncbi:hypothetical protein ACP6EM_27940, partial [Klebsiella pneumoniae subsp. pneumoniae]|uniref:hypothetical protein n=1 Tax=Klebsiella pneumoniae TaxID=573 RepID=UPI003CFAE071
NINFFKPTNIWDENRRWLRNYVYLWHLNKYWSDEVKKFNFTCCYVSVEQNSLKRHLSII